MDITCRQATTADLELLARTRVEFMADAHPDMTESLKCEMYLQNRAYLEESLHDGSFTAYLAFDGDDLAGTSGVNFYKTPPNPPNPTGKTAYISNMYSKPAYRGRGIATRLFALTMDEAKRRGCGKVILHATDMGRPIYEKYGFFVPKGAMEYYYKED